MAKKRSGKKAPGKPAKKAGKPAKKAAPAKKAVARKTAPPKQAAPKKAAPKKAAPKKAAPKKAAPKKGAPAKKAPPKKAPADLASIQREMEKGFELVRKHENQLARRIDEVRKAGEGILDQLETLQGAETPVGAPGLGRFDKTIASLQEEIRELSKDTQLCNAGPVVERIPQFEAQVKGLAAEVGALKTGVRELTAKLNEIAAKFNMHSHFLKAKNWNQDLFFHTAPPSADREQVLPETPQALGLKPTRPAGSGGEHAVILRLTPPRHWDDPVLWFDNVAPVEEKEEG